MCTISYSLKADSSKMFINNMTKIRTSIYSYFSIKVIFAFVSYDKM